MAQLKKNAIKKAIRSIEKSYDYHNYNGKYDVLVDLDELVDLIVSITTPTTTEAEIRAKAIDEFAEKLKEAFSEKSSNVNVRGFEINVLPLDRAIEILWYLKQQLKEE